MSARFEELDYRETAIGAISLRRRREPVTGKDIHEVKLDDDFLMSSLFTVAEEELARLALAELDGGRLDVVVGGLGLGFTALTVLEDARVRSLVVVEALEEVVGWHRDGLIPAGATLTADPRCRLVHGDFFALNASAQGLDPEQPGALFDAIVVDIDHSPSHLLNSANAGFYTEEGLRHTAARLRPGGVFTLWSNDPPEDWFGDTLRAVFATVRADVVEFANPLQGGTSSNTVYVGSAPLP